MIARVLVLFSGVVILGCMILFLLPEKHGVKNSRYSASKELNADSVGVVSEKNSFKSSVVSMSIEGADRFVSVDSLVDESSTVNAVLTDNTKRKVIDPRCYRIGLFIKEKGMKDAVKYLAGYTYKVVEKKSRSAFATRVYLGSFDTVAMAREADMSLSARGVEDHFYKKTSDGSYIVSLGVFSKNTLALSRKDYLNSIGLDAKTRIEKTKLPGNYWLELPSTIAKKDAVALSSRFWGEGIAVRRQKCSS